MQFLYLFVNFRVSDVLLCHNDYAVWNVL